MLSKTMNAVIITSLVTVPSLTKTAVCYKTVDENGATLEAGTWFLPSVVTINNKDEQDALLASVKINSEWAITLDAAVTWAEVLADAPKAS